ncbi:hypothetical protein LTR78_010198 [Recurvomyces mirabilis]|uniref:Uncharacterized protein n=1 Tax=Recurvomyces mirabilis TaxID=574656 RepID=A0AAE0TMU8_9PEZI|nr:hypothetical protein LTR78_010198 [Recurvomyces mirabilis]KAK5149727.1 hypothetical protein LTS14_010725 [Recurvomyces mirabilis]
MSVTQDQREEAVKQWRASSQAQTMNPTAAEAIEDKVLAGEADAYLEQLTTTTAPRTPTHGRSHSDSSFVIKLIRSIQLPSMAPMPGYPLLPYLPGTAPMPQMQPMAFPGLSPLPAMLQLPGSLPMRATPSMPFPARYLAQPLSPNNARHMATMSNIFNTPNISAQPRDVPSGSAQHSNIGLSGTTGGAQFGYCLSGISGQWDDPSIETPLPPGLLAPIDYAQMHALPAQISSTRQQPPPLYGGVPVQSTTSAYTGSPPELAFDIPAFDPTTGVAQNVPRTERNHSGAMPSQYVLNESTIDAEPQNHRMHDTFTQQLEREEKTYFGELRDAPDKPVERKR